MTREKATKSDAWIVTPARCVMLQMAEVAVLRELFEEILRMIAQFRQPPSSA
jgi:hypothetical protein